MASTIVFIVSSPLYSNPRALKIVTTLSKRFRIHILAWNRDNIKQACYIIKNMSISYLNVSAPYGKISLILYYPLFWSWVIVNTIINVPKIIYACNLDSLIPSFISKYLLGSKLIFDSFDKFSLAFISHRHKILFKLIDFLENILARNSSVFITVSKEHMMTYGKFIPKNTEIIMNVPKDRLTDVKKILLSKLLNSDNNKLTMVYCGYIGWDRGLLLLKEAIRGLNDVQLFIAGKPIDDTLALILQSQNVIYFGQLSYDKAIELEAKADVIPILYDPKLPINRLASPNKLFEAMMLGVPVITNVSKDLVKETKCGLIVDYKPDEVREAIIYLKNNPNLRLVLGINGRIAFEKKYNWAIMEDKLINLCKYLLL